MSVSEIMEGMNVDNIKHQSGSSGFSDGHIWSSAGWTARSTCLAWRAWKAIAGVMLVMVFKRGVNPWYCAHRMAADMAVSFLVDPVLSIFVVRDFLILLMSPTYSCTSELFLGLYLGVVPRGCTSGLYLGVVPWGCTSKLHLDLYLGVYEGLCVCVSHVPVVCDDSGCVRSGVGSVITLMAGRRERGHLWCQYPQCRRSFLHRYGGPGSVDWGGWLRHRVPGVLPNDADTAHAAQFFRHVQFCYNDE